MSYFAKPNFIVYDEWFDNDFKKLKNSEEDEINVLKKYADKPNANSRLACQVELKKEHNNITVTVAQECYDNFFESWDYLLIWAEKS